MNLTALFKSGALAAAVMTSGTALAEEYAIGELEYRAQCSICHGASGKGDGLYIEFLNKKPSDLTTLAQRNNGRFPLQRVYEVIDGKQASAAHGPRDMPIWGNRYAMEIIRQHGPYAIEHPDSVRGRILSLVFYLGTIQQ